LTRLYASQAMNNATNPNPTRERAAGRCRRLRSDAPGEG
jgi:hypothetical protein